MMCRKIFPIGLMRLQTYTRYALLHQLYWHVSFLKKCLSFNKNTVDPLPTLSSDQNHAVFHPACKYILITMLLVNRIKYSACKWLVFHHFWGAIYPKRLQQTILFDKACHFIWIICWQTVHMMCQISFGFLKLVSHWDASNLRLFRD